MFDWLKERLFGYRSPQQPAIAGKPPLSQVSSPLARSAEPHEIVPKSKPDETPKIERVLFVCSGNMCRSPYGAARFEQLTQGRNIRVLSAGTLRINGRKAAPEMIATAAERGLNLENHRSSALSAMFIQAADVIFVMEEVHRQEILRLCPDAKERIEMLGLWLPEPTLELVDPMGKAPVVYRAVAEQIDEALTAWCRKQLA